VIYLFHGTDSAKARAKAFQWIAAARAKQPDAAYIRLGADALSKQSLLEAVGTQGLFYTKTLVLLDDPFEVKDAGEIVLEHLDMLAESANPIGILAPKLLAARAKKLEAKAEKVFKIDAIEKKEARGFNLWKLDMFKDERIEKPWFKTLNDFIPGQGAKVYTQDLYFFERAGKVGYKFACDTRVKVGHLDPQTDIVW
jgi:hypothetical protein